MKTTKKHGVSNRSTLARLLKVAVAFSSPQGATVLQVASQLEASPRTIHRDIVFLRDRLGLEIECEVKHAPWRQSGIEHYRRATNAAEVSPMLETIGRLVI